MKKSLLILSMAMFSMVHAQKGTVLVLGNVGYYSRKSDVSLGGSPKQNSFNFSPKVGYQYADNWTVGFESSIGNAQDTYYPSLEYKSNDLSIGGFLRYSKPLGGNFSAYVDLGTGYHNTNQSQYNGGINPSSSTLKGNGFYIGVTPALLLDISKGFGLNFNFGSIGYSTLDYSNSGYDTQNFHFRFGQAFNIGISKNF
jgi:hypothetical protein